MINSYLFGSYNGSCGPVKERENYPSIISWYLAPTQTSALNFMMVNGPTVVSKIIANSTGEKK